MFSLINNFLFGDPIHRLFEALSVGRVEALHKYLRAGGDPNASRGPIKNSTTCLIGFAARTNHISEVDLLLSYGANINGEDLSGQCLLHYLADSTNENNSIVIRKILEMGMNPDGNPAASATPLYIAASRGNMAVVSELLKFGANPNIPNWGGMTPLEVLGHFRDGMIFINKTNSNSKIKKNSNVKLKKDSNSK